MFKKLGTALITPFIDSNSIDFNSFKKLLKHQEDNKVDYIVIAGTTGEAATLSDEEIFSLVNFAKENSKLKIVVGLSGNATNKFIDKLKLYENNLNIDGYLISSPYYNKPSQEGIYEHYKLISNNTKRPIILYNIPGRTGSKVEVDTIIKIIRECKNIVAIKDAVNSFEFSMNLISNLKKHKLNFTCLSGDDANTLSFLSIGYHGAISVVSNEIPLEIKTMIDFAMNNDFNSAREILYSHLDLMNINFIEANPIPIKYIMHKFGFCDGSLRLPLVRTLKNKLIDEVIKNYV